MWLTQSAGAEMLRALFALDAWSIFRKSWPRLSVRKYDQ
jgi:hypothetical protein